jgi:ferrous iron transport protein A
LHLIVHIMQTTVLKLKIGESAVLAGFDDAFLGARLMEMGFLPGERIVLERIAPLGDPVVIRLFDCSLGLRLSEAGSVLVEQHEK